MEQFIDNIPKVEGKHLGSGKRYETPTQISPHLLVGVPRDVNREKPPYFIKFAPGYDVWNCYEVSVLRKNGVPVVGVLKLVYPSASKNIVESKSLKLYLNSFNFVRAPFDDLYQIGIWLESTVIEHLCSIVKDQVSCFFHYEDTVKAKPITGPFINIDEATPYSRMNVEGNTCHFHSRLLRSNCRVTNQPDWADIYFYVKDEIIPPYTFIEYITALRNENHFHEEICEQVFTHFKQGLNPDELFVACLYTRRGGIDINPVRATSNDLVVRYANGLINPLYLNEKSMRH